MKQETRPITLPLFVLEIGRDETDCRSVDDIVAHFREAIDAHPSAKFVGLFDHYAHTAQLPDGEIAPDVMDAKCVVFCFGMAIPEACALATRPRSIGIAEREDGFVVSFLEAPMPVANSTLEAWARALIKTPDPSPRSEAGGWRIGLSP